VNLNITGFQSRPLVKLGNSFKQLLSLENIELYHINLGELPNTIVNLKKLKSLRIRQTKLKSLSISLINELESIELLDLRFNQGLQLSESGIKKLEEKVGFFYLK